LACPYSEPLLLKLAYSYEQATHHRVPPRTTPALAKWRELTCDISFARNTEPGRKMAAA